MGDLGLVHSRLSVHSIFLQKGTPSALKVGDFSGAFYLDEAGRKNGDSVPKEIRPPEAALGYRLSSAVDMWALGCLAYELVTGRPLFSYESPVENLGKALAISQRYSLVSLPDTKKKRELLLNDRLLFYAIKDGKLNVVVPLLCPSISSDILNVVPDQVLVDFVVKCLDFNPVYRMTVDQALSHPFLLKTNQ